MFKMNFETIVWCSRHDENTREFVCFENTLSVPNGQAGHSVDGDLPLPLSDTLVSSTNSRTVSSAESNVIYSLILFYRFIYSPFHFS